jgi:hypothetical protein
MWFDLGFSVVVLLALWGLAAMTGLTTRLLSRRTDRTAASMYASYGRLTRRQRRAARRDDARPFG